MTGNPADDWKALLEHYRSMSDGQLCELACAFNDLRPTAQQLLRDEMKLRMLGDPQSPDWAKTQDGVGEVDQSPNLDLDPALGDLRPVEYTWKTLLCDCESGRQAWQIAEVLRRVGIESWLDGPGRYSPYRDLDAGGARVLVAADQLEEAKAIAAHPIPADIVEASQMPDEVETLYEPPVCPRCGAVDPLLENVDPVNTWACEACGAEWTEER